MWNFFHYFCLPSERKCTHPHRTQKRQLERQFRGVCVPPPPPPPPVSDGCLEVGGKICKNWVLQPFHNRVYNYVCRYTTYLRHSCEEVVGHPQPVAIVPTAKADHAHDRGDQFTTSYNWRTTMYNYARLSLRLIVYYFVFIYEAMGIELRNVIIIIVCVFSNVCIKQIILF